jgi:hypothetical protein
MVTLTRRTTTKNDAIEHVLLTLIGINVKSHMYNVLYEEGIIDTSHIMNITENELSLYNTNVVDDKGIIVKRAKTIPRFHHASILLMGAMLVGLREEKGSALEDDEIMKITKAEFDTYRTSTPIPSRQQSNNSNNNNSTSTQVASTSINTDVKDIIKGNKHDKT